VYPQQGTTLLGHCTGAMQAVMVPWMNHPGRGPAVGSDEPPASQGVGGGWAGARGQRR